MEKKLKDTSSPTSSHGLKIENRKFISLSGVIEVVSATPNLIVAKTELGPLNIVGNELKITMLDIENKIVEAAGEINEIKYLSKKSLFQRMFK